MIVLSGADIVLPDRVLHSGSLVLQDGRIEAVLDRSIDGPAPARIDCRGLVIAPGFVDVHVHGVEGIDALDGPTAVADIAARLPRYGVTAFCPTSVACEPETLAAFLASVGAAMASRPAASARVLPAHLESNFINPEWKGAQPQRCLRLPPAARNAATGRHRADAAGRETMAGAGFDGADILRVIAAGRSSAGIITLAPELPGALALVCDFIAAGHRVSIGHTGATYEEARAAIDAGARHATHLFNRMPPIASRSPGCIAAVFETDAVAAEIICDGVHVHPALVAMALRLKSARRLMAITDGTAGAGLAPGSRTRLGEQTIIVTAEAATLADGTLAGSILTMDGAFRMLVERTGVSLPDAARMCATTPAAELGMLETGSIAPGRVADLVVLDSGLRVRQTYLAGVPALEH
jgi:N-acetylglucosamine-6-phosphate deacetylase